MWRGGRFVCGGGRVGLLEPVLAAGADSGGGGREGGELFLGGRRRPAGACAEDVRREGGVCGSAFGVCGRLMREGGSWVSSSLKEDDCGVLNVA